MPMSMASARRGFAGSATASVARSGRRKCPKRRPGSAAKAKASTIDIAAAIIAESTLSFLGLGFPPDIPTWGRILYDGRDYMDLAMHWALFPGIAIFLTVLTIYFIGDGLRDALDPRRVL